jgi:septum formation protein
MTLSAGRNYVLGSRSPRRLELLQQIVPADSIEVLPPRSADEANFDGLSDWSSIERRLLEIARAKCADVLEQLRARPIDARPTVITADTVVVVGGVVGGVEGPHTVLGQPPDGPAWRETVRQWFLEYYDDQTHVVATAMCVAWADRPPVERVVRTSVTFHADVSQWLEWYLATGEPCGKAGGYAVQGAGSVFISRIDGSLSNVVGLPLRELLDVLTETGDVTAR